MRARFLVDEQMDMKSVVEYFQEMHAYTIQHSCLPCLQVGDEKKSNYFLMEALTEFYDKVIDRSTSTEVLSTVATRLFPGVVEL